MGRGKPGKKGGVSLREAGKQSGGSNPQTCCRWDIITPPSGQG